MKIQDVETTMNPFTKFLRVILIILTFFLSIAAILGGITLMANFYAPPVEMLQGIFASYTIPGLALSLLVGGSALFAANLLLRKSGYALVFTATAGIVVMFFEFAEVLIIGSPVGPSRDMQIIFFVLGTVIEIASIGSWFLGLRSTR